MTFIRKASPNRTCKDFKPSLWDRSGCRLTHLCGDAKNHWVEFGRCIGIKPQELWSPKGLQSGVLSADYGEKSKNEKIIKEDFQKSIIHKRPEPGTGSPNSRPKEIKLKSD